MGRLAQTQQRALPVDAVIARRSSAPVCHGGLRRLLDSCVGFGPRRLLGSCVGFGLVWLLGLLGSCVGFGLVWLLGLLRPCVGFGLVWLLGLLCPCVGFGLVWLLCAVVLVGIGGMHGGAMLGPLLAVPVAVLRSVIRVLVPPGGRAVVGTVHGWRP